MTLRLTISSELFTDRNDQEVLVRDHLTVNSLLADICREYGLPAGNHTLRLQGGQRLKPDQTLEQSGVHAGDTLVFSVEPVELQASLVTEENKQEFILDQATCEIGRPNPQRHVLPDIDLTEFDFDRTVSRPHARVTLNQGTYYVESLNENNLAYVNNIAVPVGVLQPLRSNDWLRLGKVRLQFVVSVT